MTGRATRGTRVCSTVGAIAGVMIAVAGCRGGRAEQAPTPSDAGVAPESYWPAQEWRRATPASQRVDGEVIGRFVQRVRSEAPGYRGFDALVIVRNGYLVVDEYFAGWGPEEVHTVQSTTKSVTSLLVGLAIQRGALHGVTDSVFPYFRDYRDLRNMDERKASLRVEDLLTMRTGMNFFESPYAGSPLQQLNDTTHDWARFVADFPVSSPPGDKWQYNSGGVVLAGGLLRRAVRMRPDSFAQQALFTPIGIPRVRWASSSLDSLPHMGGGLSLRPKDMARIGYLVLRGGKWNGRQLVAEDWIRKSTSRLVKNARTFGGHPSDYGYYWWLMPLDSASRRDAAAGGDIIAASGNGGQIIFIIPKYDAIVVTTGELPNPEPLFIIDILYRDILPAIRP